MPSGKTIFNAAWQSSFDWIRAVDQDVSKALCAICGKTFSICNSGILQVKQHNSTNKHQQMLRNADHGASNSSQSRFVVGSCGALELEMPSGGKLILTSEDQIMKAEILWALKCVQNNFSFKSNNDMNELFKSMFPDSKIAAGYEMAETKTKYVIQFGIRTYVMEQLMEDLKDVPFTFKFDETTTSQIKKQYDGYIQYESKKFGKIITHYVGSLFLGHCNAEALKDHFFEFIEKLKLDVKFLLHIGMDGPNVNLAFQKLLEKELLEKDGKQILNIGTCTLHPIHTAFVRGLTKIDFDFNKVAYDLHFFFKYSSARREDFRLCGLETDLEAEFTLKHCQSRWLSLRKVLSRIQEQWSNLKHYFLTFLPKQANFSREIENTERYKFIKRTLKSETSLLNIGFAIHLAEILETFLVKFQSNEPKIHQLYSGFGDIFFHLMSNFIDKQSLLNEDQSRKEAKILGCLDITDTAIQTSIHSIDYGTKVKHLVATIERTKNLDSVKTEFKLAYIETTKYLQKLLPHQSNFLRDTQFLHPVNIVKDNSNAAISRLAFTMANILRKSSALTKKSPEEFADTIILELKMFKSEENEVSSVDGIEAYYNILNSILDLHGKPRYKNLVSLAKVCLCVSHGNADPERGFSINKDMLEGKVLLKEDTIISLRLVKQHLLLQGKLENFKITRRLLTLVSKSRSEYNRSLEEERDKKTLAESRKRTITESENALKKAKEDVNSINLKISADQIKLKAAENLIESGNSSLETAINAKVFSKKKVQEAKAMIDMGLEKSKTIKKNIETLEAKRNEFLKKKKI